MHPGLKLRHIRLFLQLADSGSATAAGKAAGLSQPAVSRALAEMEEMLGTPLFLRQARRLTLTDAGAVFHRHVREAMASLDAAASALSGDRVGGRLAVGLLPTVSNRFFPAILGRFLADRPDVTLSMESGPHPFLLQKLRDRQIDLMIGRMPLAAEMAGMEFEFLYEEPIVAVVRAGHPLARAPLDRLLREVPVVLPTRDAIIRGTVDDFLASIGHPRLVPAVETTTLALGRGLLLATDAIWFISKGVVEGELDEGTLLAVPLGASYLSGAVGLTYVAGGTLPPPLVKLMQLAHEAAEARRPTSPARAPRLRAVPDRTEARTNDLR
ncbi:MAG TPA: LysR substrate-binding domain-containing protein [Paracoccaceae bacterium]|nr:LysR substrate-binding domain-containing protein [Paracoccaceae bacterium]